MSAAIADSLDALTLPNSPLGDRLRLAIQHWRERQDTREFEAWCAWLDSTEGHAWLEEQADSQDRRSAGLYR